MSSSVLSKFILHLPIHRRTKRRRAVVAALAATIAMMATFLPTAPAAAAMPGHDLPGSPMPWKGSAPPVPGEWIFTTEEEVAPECGVAEAAAGQPNRGFATEHNGELWSNAGLGQPTQVQLTMWQPHYLDPGSQISGPWQPTETTTVQARARVDATPNRPTDAMGVVEVQYAEVRHQSAGNPNGEVDVVKWAVRVNRDKTIDYWSDVAVSGNHWNHLATIPTSRSLDGVPVTARFTAQSDATGDRYAGDLVVLIGNEYHSFSMDGRSPLLETKPDWAPSVTFSLENATNYDSAAGACRQRVNNERAITRYELAYSGIIAPSDPMGACTTTYSPLDCLPASVDLGPKCAGQYVTVDLSRGDTPTNGDDVILGTPGHDVIDGLGGNDVICGVGGNDRITGGAGADRIFGGSGHDKIWGGDGNDTIRGQDGIDALVGGEGDDTMSGGSSRDVLVGGDGNDNMDGGADRDRLFGGDGADQMTGGADTDYVRGNAGDDSLRSGPSGNDRLVGDSGNDHLDARETSGSTRMVGGSGNDLMHGSRQLDRMWGNAGNDIMHGNGYDDLIRAGDGNDTVIAGPGNDSIDGGSGNDNINGNSGNDLMVGMAGVNDVCDGGPGTDRAHATCEFVFNAP